MSEPDYQDLEQRLASLQRPPETPAFPEDRDAAIRAAARSRAVVLQGSKPVIAFPQLLRWAAALALGLGISFAVYHRLQPDPGAAVRGGDLNHDGRVDIIDVYLLASNLEAGETNPAWDVNRDGMVDRGDVQDLSASLVKLDGEES